MNSSHMLVKLGTLGIRVVRWGLFSYVRTHRTPLAGRAKWCYLSMYLPLRPSVGLCHVCLVAIFPSRTEGLISKIS